MRPQDKRRAPFPYFGGKRDAAALVWEALGNPANYIEPFAGSLAVLLQRPTESRVVTLNDACGLLANVWRSLQGNPAAVARHAEWPICEVDVHARHLWLVNNRARMTEQLLADPSWFDAQAAGWWIWGACSWIGSGWCSGKGGWALVQGRLVKVRDLPPELAAAVRETPMVSRQLPALGNDGHGIHSPSHRGGLQEWFEELANILRHARICCGDWSRVVAPSVTWKHLTMSGKLHFEQEQVCGLFLDPPYSDLEGYYAVEDGRGGSTTPGAVAEEVRAWCLENGQNPKLRIVLAGFEGQGHEELESQGWRCIPWFKAGFLKGGFASMVGNGQTQQHRERLWLSPHCLQANKAPQLGLWDEE